MLFDPVDVRMGMGRYEVLVVDGEFRVRIVPFQVKQKRVGFFVNVSSEGQKADRAVVGEMKVTDGAVL